MKHNILKSIMFGAVAGVLITSCTEDALDDLTGKYPAPTEYSFTSIASSNVEKQEDRRIFTIDFATSGITGSNGQYSGTGSVLSMQFVNTDYYLQTAAYTAKPEDSAVKGNYIAGYGTNSGSCFFDVSNGSSTPNLVSHGSLSVTKLGDSFDYTISGVVWLANGDIIKVNAAWTLVYEKDPDPIALTNLFANQVQPGAGQSTVTLKISTKAVGATFNPNTYGYDFTGTGNYISIDFITADGTLPAGTYTPASAETAAPGNYVKGYDTEMDFGWGPMPFYNWGTCWFDIANGVETGGTHIETGDIVVKKNGHAYTITLTNDDLYVVYEGFIEPVTLTNLFTASVSENTMTLKIADANITPAYNAEAWAWQYTGTGGYISIDIYTADGKTLAPGTYTAVDNTSLGEFNFSKGYDTIVDWGWGPMEMFNWGSCWFTVINGTETGQHLTEGTIIVTEADGVYTLAGDFGALKVNYTGAIVIG